MENSWIDTGPSGDEVPIRSFPDMELSSFSDADSSASVKLSSTGVTISLSVDASRDAPSVTV